MEKTSLEPLRFFVRRPSPDELTWFKVNPDIAGYASEDNYVVLNPFSKLTITESASIVINEGVRLMMRAFKLAPHFQITATQRKRFSNTIYESNSISLCETILARIIAGDPSSENPTELQLGYAQAISDIFDNLVILEGSDETHNDLLDVVHNLRNRARN
jgi:hypothetical protein